MPEKHDAIRIVRDALASQRLTINALDDGSGVLLDIDGEKLLTLNRSGMTLVRAIEEGAEDAAALRERLCARFDVDAERAETDAAAFVQEVAQALE
jgi:hypothetical protein